MSKFFQNPVSDGGQAGRVDDIKSEYANGSITQEQYNDLMDDEATTRGYVQLKRVAAFTLCALVGFFVIWSSL